MIQFSGTYSCRLALVILKCIKQIMTITSRPGEGKERVFLECVKGTLDRSKLLADMVRSEVVKLMNDPSDPQAHLVLVQKLELEVVSLRELIITTVRLARKFLYGYEVMPTVLSNGIRSIGRSIKEIIIMSKEIENQFPKETGSVLDSIHRHFNSEFPNQPPINEDQGEQIDDNDVSTNFADLETSEAVAPVSVPAAAPSVPPVSTIAAVAAGTAGPAAATGITPAAPSTVAAADLSTMKLENGIELFNAKWKKGLQYLISENILKEDTKSIAKFLNDYNDKLSKEQMGEILAGRNEEDTELLVHFTALMDFKGDSFDQSLRKYLKKFMLPGEAQKISRIMEVFAAEFLNQNPAAFPNKDVAFVLSFSLIMLNTDAHNPAIPAKDKMTKDQFVQNNRGTWVDGADPPKELLEELYDKIVTDEISMQTKGDPDKKGWLKAMHAGSLKEGRRWFVLVKNELRWYKTPVLAINGKDDEMKGKIILEFMQVKDDDTSLKITISSLLPNKNIEFYLCEKGGKETPQPCKRFVLTAETSKQMKSWAAAIRDNVSLEEIPTKLDFMKNASSPKTPSNRKTGIRNKNKNTRTSYSNVPPGSFPTPSVQPPPLQPAATPQGSQQAPSAQPQTQSQPQPKLQQQQLEQDKLKKKTYTKD